jgi:hypothetical protein
MFYYHFACFYNHCAVNIRIKSYHLTSKVFLEIVVFIDKQIELQRSFIEYLKEHIQIYVRESQLSPENEIIFHLQTIHVVLHIIIIISYHHVCSHQTEYVVAFALVCCHLTPRASHRPF